MAGEVRPAKSGEGGPPRALEHREEIFRRARGKRLAVFLDYDGTLTPIVARPEAARLAGPMRRTLRELAAHCPVAVISGRDLKDVQNLVGLDSLYYAGSHGFEIAGPAGRRLEARWGTEFLPALDRAEKSLRRALEGKIPGVQVERKRLAVAVHYRRVAAARAPEVERAVDRVRQEAAGLRRGRGKKVWELLPDLDWDKGQAVLWLLRQMNLEGPEALPVYLGDDGSDEAAFRVLRERGFGIVVQEEERPSAARYRLRDPAEVQKFLQGLWLEILR